MAKGFDEKKSYLYSRNCVAEAHHIPYLTKFM